MPTPWIFCLVLLCLDDYVLVLLLLDIFASPFTHNLSLALCMEIKMILFSAAAELYCRRDGTEEEEEMIRGS